MPKEYTDCVKVKLKQGMSRDESQKVCAIAYYEVHGKTPKEADSQNTKGLFDYSFDIVKFDTKERTIEGYASVEILDHDNEIIGLEALKSGLSDYMVNPILKLMHHDLAIGKILEAEIDDVGLYVKAKISTKTRRAVEAWGLVEEGIIKAFSIGGKIIDYVDETVKDTERMVRRITKMKLLEISIVDIPANPASFFTVVSKSLNGGVIMEDKDKNINATKHVTKDEAKKTEEAKLIAEQAVRDVAAKDAADKAKAVADAEAKAKADAEAKDKVSKKDATDSITMIKSLEAKIEALEATKSTDEIAELVKAAIKEVELERTSEAKKTHENAELKKSIDSMDVGELAAVAFGQDKQ